MPLPHRPDLTHLKREARALQLAASRGEHDSLRRVRAFFPDEASPLKLSHAQLVIAREYGFDSWPKLAEHVEKRAQRRKLKAERAKAFQDDAAALAESWFALVERGDLRNLAYAMAVSKRRMLAARTIMQGNTARYDGFLDGVMKGLSSDNPRTRFECAHTLDVFGDARCRDPLVKLMDDPVPRVRWMAMHALSCHACNSESCSEDDSVRDRIEESALKDESILVRRHAVYSLGLMNARAAADTLRRIIADESDAQMLRAAKWALRKCTAGGAAPPSKSAEGGM
jgi:hypothetical protein